MSISERATARGRSVPLSAVGHEEVIVLPDVDPVGIAESEPGRALRRFEVIGGLMALSDAACICVALLFAYLLRFNFAPVPGDYLLVLGLAPVAWVFVFRVFGLYSPRLLSRAEEMRRTVSAVGVGVLMVAVASYWSKSEFSRSWLALSLMLAFAFEMSVRWGWRYYIRTAQRDGRLAFRTLVVGNREDSENLVDILSSSGSGFIPMGCIDIAHLRVDTGLWATGLTEKLGSVIRRYGVDCVFVTSPNLGPREMLGIAQATRREGVELRVYTHLIGILSTRLSVLQVGSGAMALSFRPVSLSGAQKALKRTFDLTMGSLALILLSPVLVAAAVAVRMTSPGPVLFRQQRVTEDGRRFTMHKFRTMESGDPSNNGSPDQHTPFFKLKEDPRLTSVGRVLRKWSIDELPQLFDVLGGTMSMVGPRPLPSEQVEANQDLLGPRHEVKTGITGWWQINGRSDLTPETALQHDLFYIENWSLGLDLYVLLRTVWVLVTRRGAY